MLSGGVSLWRAAGSRLRSVERADAAMLMLPFLLVAATIGVARWNGGDPNTRPARQWAVSEGSGRALVGLPREAVPAPIVGLGNSIPAARDWPATELGQGAHAASPAWSVAVPPDAVRPAASELAAVGAATQPADTPHISPPRALAPRTLDGAPAAGAPTEPALSLPPVSPPGDDARLIVGVPPQVSSPIVDGAAVASLGPDDAVAVRNAPHGMFGVDAEETQCRPAKPEEPFALPAGFDPGDPEAFGVVLAQAARTQLDDFVIYNDRYTRLAYPMGDVNPMYGVCTDVVIRAYRALGVDLQALVQTTRAGSGDPNIDHRRVDTLRRFFQRHGEILPISNFAEDFRPGDIVTYWRPQNRHSRTHIAIVSDLIGASGRPLIIHNRGWGPQQEDGLFVDQITGHFRFSGLKPAATLYSPRPGAAAGGKVGKISTAPEPQRSQVIRAGLPVQERRPTAAIAPVAPEK